MDELANLGPVLPLLASALAGLAAALAVRAVAVAAVPAVRANTGPGDADGTRLGRLRAASGFYRYAGGLVDRLGAWNDARLSGAARDRLTADLRAAGLAAPWKPGEYLAVVQLQAAAAGLGVGAVAALLAGSAVTGGMVGGLAGFAVYTVASRDAASKAAARRKELLTRLPFVLDLVALMMASGASFQDALAASVAELAGHPLGDELADVLRDIRFNRPRREALLAFEARVGDPAVSDLVFAVVKGEELGTPLGVAVRQQADLMRVRRSQAMEKEAAEAQVGIVFPGFLIMIACVLIVLAPFVLRAAGSGGAFN